METRDVAATLIVQNGRLLLLTSKRSTPERLEPPGGKPESEETLEETAIRETKKEIGVWVAIIRLFHISEVRSVEGNFRVHMFLVKIIEGTPELKKPDKFSAFGWYSFSEIFTLSLNDKLALNIVALIPHLPELFTGPAL